MDVTVRYYDRNGQVIDSDEFAVGSKDELIEYAKTMELGGRTAYAHIFEGTSDEVSEAELAGTKDELNILAVAHCGTIWDCEKDEWIVEPKYWDVEDAFRDGREFDGHDCDGYTVREFDGTKYVLLDRIGEDGKVEAVKLDDEIDYDTGWYTCPAYMLEFDDEDDDDPIAWHNVGDIAYITD